MNRKFLWFTFLLLLSIISYYRELVFRSINAIIAGQTSFYSKTTELSYLLNWSESELIHLKYFLTITFTFVFMALSFLGLRISFISKLASQLIILFYSLILLITISVFVYTFCFSDFKNTYPLLRKLVGMVHSPLPFLIISIGIYAFKKLDVQ